MRYVLAFVLLLAIGGWIESPAHGAPYAPRAVSLADAKVPPTMLRYVLPGRAYTPSTDTNGRPCTSADGTRSGYYTDVSAYRWNGRAHGAQRFNRRALVSYWHIPGRVGAVVYDGLTFRNDTFRPVLVAGWCDA